MLFHARQKEVTPSITKQAGRKAAPDDGRYRDLLDGLKSLGLANVTTAEVEAALKDVRPSNSAGKKNGDVLRAVFLRLKRQDASSRPGKE